MKRKYLVILFVILTATACVNRAGEKLLNDGNKVAATSTPPSIGNVQITQGRILPPYGMKVEADRAALKLRVSSSKGSVSERLDDIQVAVTQISLLASENDLVNLAETSVNHVSSVSSSRATAMPYFAGIDSSSVTLQLTIDLDEQNRSLFDSVILFDNFLKGMNLSETVTVEASSIEAEISNPEMYRPELIGKVYEELAAVQKEYGQSVMFEITGLHGNLQSIPLTDTEFYLYIEPTIIVSEF